VCACGCCGKLPELAACFWLGAASLSSIQNTPTGQHS
jgi:hypothetical protein